MNLEKSDHFPGRANEIFHSCNRNKKNISLTICAKPNQKFPVESQSSRKFAY